MNDDAAKEQWREAAAQRGRELAEEVLETARLMNQVTAAEYAHPTPNHAEVQMAAQHDRRITSAECYLVAGKPWMPTAGREALVRAARTIAALERRTGP